ncbi:IS1380 family transposase [candidate division CSSED10-310 bacterium]|uniref:IS1380 family transposase n=1 Tax=candidate division CSSED10-310 bacterium TaxID=2855610 RepID=A0ABV6YVX1_UNCC1
MTQGILPFKYEIENKPSGMTSLAGLPLYYELATVTGISQSVTHHLPDPQGSQGWTNNQCISALVMLNLAGGSTVDDLRIMESDYGLIRFLQKIETHGLNRDQRRALELRWRKENNHAVPSPSAMFRFLNQFHFAQEEEKRVAGKAFIPAPNKYLQGLVNINKDIVAFKQAHSPFQIATLDMDATLIETSKNEALYCYKGFEAYQPLNTYWFEQDLVLHSEFRDGNVPAGYDQLRVFKEALNQLPVGVEQTYLRSDTAGYQIDLIKYCAKGMHERFGVIKFGICVDVTESFKNAVRDVPESEWYPIYTQVNGKSVPTGQQWAEVCYVPNWAGYSKKDPEYRFIAIRETIKQLVLPEMEDQLTFPFPTMDFKSKGKYKLFGVVTNFSAQEKSGDQVIAWNRERCGSSEKAHAIMKNDLAGGTMPSGKFGANAAWWQMMIFAYNLNSIMKRDVLSADNETWMVRCMKALRFYLINLPARVHKHAKQMVITLGHNHPMNETILRARARMLALAHGPPCSVA